MSFSPDSMQRLLLWRLAVSDAGGEFLKDIEANITPAKRSPLVREGLIEEERRKAPTSRRSSIYLELTDKGWAWCGNNMDDDFTSRSLISTPILARLLKLLKRYFESQDHTVSLGQFIRQARSEAKAASAPPAAEEGEDADELLGVVRKTCLELADGQENVRVRLADLRSRLTDVPRQSLDASLLEMAQAGELSLFRLDNPQEIHAEDRDAVLLTATGQERHIVYFGGRGS